MSGNWRDKFEPIRVPPTALSAETGLAVEDDHGAPDLTAYQPWIVQRGRSRAPLLLQLRKFDPKSGLLIGWQASYPYLVSADYVGERMLSLDFGRRQFVIQGTDLGDLLRHFQQGTVLAIQEYSAHVWPHPPAGPIVTAIDKIERPPIDA